MFRKTYTELEELQNRAIEIFSVTGAIYKVQPSADYPLSNSWYWPNGATVKMRYIESEKDYGRYHGHQYTGISFDEVTEYATPDGLFKMLSTLRSPAGVPCTVRLTGNPGGVGHGWVKQRYIDGKTPYLPFKDPDTGFTRMFIPSKTSDNDLMLSKDPFYRNRIKAATAGNDALRRAWLEGDWDVVAGAFFDCWRNSKHVVKPFQIPEHWLRFRSGDWGSARPFAFHWFAVASEDHVMDSGTIQKGCLVCYREWYGMARDHSGQPKYNTGLKMDAEEVGRGLLQRERERVSYGVLDPAAFSHDGGPSIAERIQRGSGNKIHFRRADNSRVGKRGALGGWDQMRARLVGEEEKPMLVFFNTCVDAIRTIPQLQHDPDNLEDVNTDSEDHAPDSVRYACMSRPYVSKLPHIPENVYPINQTINELLKAHREKRAAEE
jgi:hypothetical protein